MAVAMVPKPVPVAVAKRAEAINVISTNTTGPTPRLAEKPAIANASPDELSTFENTPAKNQQRIGVIASRLDIPSTNTEEYIVLSFAKKNATIIAIKAGNHKAPLEMDLQTNVVRMIKAINTTNGMNENHSPP